MRIPEVCKIFEWWYTTMRNRCHTAEKPDFAEEISGPIRPPGALGNKWRKVLASFDSCRQS